MLYRMFGAFITSLGAAGVVSTALPMDAAGGSLGFALVLTPVMLVSLFAGAEAGWGRVLLRLGEIGLAVLTLVTVVLGVGQGTQGLGFAATAVVGTAIAVAVPGLGAFPAGPVAERRIERGRFGVLDVAAVIGMGALVWGAVGLLGIAIGTFLITAGDVPTGVAGIFAGAAAAAWALQESALALAPVHPLLRRLGHGASRVPVFLFACAAITAGLGAGELSPWMRALCVVFGGLGVLATVFAPGPSPSDRHWVASREGLVHFSTDATRLYGWDDLREAHETTGGVQLHFSAALPLEMYRLHRPGSGPPIDVPELPLDRVEVPENELVEVTPAVFVAMLREALADPSSRRHLPTFAQPDGPPEAVLADLQRGSERPRVAEGEAGPGPTIR